MGVRVGGVGDKSWGLGVRGRVVRLGSELGVKVGRVRIRVKVKDVGLRVWAGGRGSGLGSG